MTIKDEIFKCLAGIEDSLERIERKSDVCVVMANRLDWQMVQYCADQHKSHLTFT